MGRSILLLSILAQAADPAYIGYIGGKSTVLVLNSFFTRFSSSLKSWYTSTVFLSIVRLMA